MRAPDKEQFKTAMRKEFNDHTKMNHWEITPIAAVSEGEPILDSVWDMRRKRSILTNKVYEWKSKVKSTWRTARICRQFL